MIGYLKGKILDREAEVLVVGIGQEEALLGYEVQVPINPLSLENYQPGSVIELYVYTHVREDALDLYGFESRETRRLFLLLMTVSGIGPRAALNLLSHMDPDVLIHAILQQDKSAFVGIKGIGKKTIERILIELKDPIAKQIEKGFLSSARSKGTAQAATHHAQSQPAFAEALFALQALGYKENEVRRALQDLIVGGSPELSSEALVKGALQRLA